MNVESIRQGIRDSLQRTGFVKYKMKQHSTVWTIGNQNTIFYYSEHVYRKGNTIYVQGYIGPIVLEFEEFWMNLTKEHCPDARDVMLFCTHVLNVSLLDPEKPLFDKSHSEWGPDDDRWIETIADLGQMVPQDIRQFVHWVESGDEHSDFPPRKFVNCPTKWQFFLYWLDQIDINYPKDFKFLHKIWSIEPYENMYYKYILDGE